MDTDFAASLHAQIAEYETEWANTDNGLQELALDAVGADSIDDAVIIPYDDTSIFDLEMYAYAWKDLMGVVAHKAHELGWYD